MPSRETTFRLHHQIDNYSIRVFEFSKRDFRNATFDRSTWRKLTFCWINVVIDSSRTRMSIEKMSSVLKSSMKYRDKTWYYRVERDRNKRDHNRSYESIAKIIRKEQKQKSIKRFVQYYLLQLSTNEILSINLSQISTEAEKSSKLYDVDLMLTTRETNEFDTQLIWTIVFLIISIFSIDFRTLLNFDAKRNYIA